MHPEYIPPIHPMANKFSKYHVTTSSKLMDPCYEAFLFMTQTHDVVVRVTLFKDSETESDTFQCICDPYINLMRSYFPVSELNTMQNFVEKQIWTSIEKQFKLDE
ncbi:unnamed protein product [Heterobilharzia americana]|nr:unnamed protein product [Heterobilharzia americana]CAH8437306.1 unnamed protein product [Heterobilharzia americana]